MLQMKVMASSFMSLYICSYLISKLTPVYDSEFWLLLGTCITDT